MQILFAILVASFLVLVGSLYAVTRHVRRSTASAADPQLIAVLSERKQPLAEDESAVPLERHRPGSVPAPNHASPLRHSA